MILPQNRKILEAMQKLANGAMTVPITVLNKGTKNQKVYIGSPESIQGIGLEKIQEAKTTTRETTTLTCPECGYKQSGAIPTTSCVPFYACNECKKIIKAQGVDCCVFCSYADKKCPLKKEAEGCSDGVCKI